MKARLFIVVFLAQLFGNFAIAQDMEKLLSEARVLPDNEQKLKVLDTICKHHMNVDTIEFYGQKQLHLANSLNNAYYKACANDILSWVWHCKLNFETSMKYRIAAIHIWDSLKMDHCLAFSYMNYATTLLSTANYTLADDYYRSSLEIFLNLSDSLHASRVMQYLGMLNIGNMLYDNADEYYNRALDIDILCRSYRGIANDYSGLGHSALSRFHMQGGDTNVVLITRAKEMLLRAYNIYNEIADWANVLYVLPKLSEVYLCEAEITPIRNAELLDSCYHYYKVGIGVVEQYGYDFAYIDLCLPYIDYLLVKHDYNKVRETLSSLSNFISEHGSSDKNFAMLNQAYINYYKAIGDYKNAFKYSELKYNDLVNENLRNNQVKLTQTKLQTEYLAEKKISEQRERQILQHSEYQRQLIAIFIIAFVVVVFFLVMIFLSARKMKQLNTELDAKNSQLENIKTRVMEQNRVIGRANKNLTASIRYAKHIQDVAMPSIDFMRSIFGECLVLYRPRDIVSGDFYWATQIGKYKVLAVADCTGHGVPGAFLSIFGISILNDLTAMFDTDNINITAATMLDNLRLKMRQALRQKTDDYSNQDGMDIALCMFNTETNQLQYAGAFRPLVIVRNNNIVQYDADRMPIGAYSYIDKPFANNVIEIEKDDIVYLYTDGITDQFSNDGLLQKFTAPRLRKLILNNYQLSFRQQHTMFNTTIDKWRTSPTTKQVIQQTDDILLVGIKFLQ